MKTIVVTGGAEFIGSCLVRQSLEDQTVDHVITLNKLTYAGNLASLEGVLENPRHTYIQADIGDRLAVVR